LQIIRQFDSGTIICCATFGSCFDSTVKWYANYVCRCL